MKELSQSIWHPKEDSHTLCPWADRRTGSSWISLGDSILLAGLDHLLSLGEGRKLHSRGVGNPNVANIRQSSGFSPGLL